MPNRSQPVERDVDGKRHPSPAERLRAPFDAYTKCGVAQTGVPKTPACGAGLDARGVGGSTATTTLS
jgi:hypothetical protein